MRNSSVFKSKRYLLIGLFVLLLAGVTLGYSALQTTLSINGKTTINKVGWDIHFENVQVKDGSVNIAGDTAAVIDPNDNTRLNYSVTLAKPGDFYDFTVDIKNAGSLDAKLADIPENTKLTAAQEVYANYSLSYVDGTEPEVGEVLKAGEKKTLHIRVEYDPDITAADLPSEPVTLSLTYKLLYEQNR